MVDLHSAEYDHEGCLNDSNFKDDESKDKNSRGEVAMFFIHF